MVVSCTRVVLSKKVSANHPKSEDTISYPEPLVKMEPLDVSSSPFSIVFFSACVSKF